MTEKLHFDLGALTELSKDNEPVVSCFKPGCSTRGKTANMRQTCDDCDCPVRAYYLHQIGDAGELSIYGAAQRFKDEWPQEFKTEKPRQHHRRFSVVVGPDRESICVRYNRKKMDSIAGMPDTFEGYAVVKIEHPEY